MALVSQRVPHLLGGVSQQPTHLRHESQTEEQINAFLSSAAGLSKRPGTTHIAQVLADADDTASVRILAYSADEKYILVFVSGDLRVFDAETGTEVTVTFPDGKAYLNGRQDATDAVDPFLGTNGDGLNGRIATGFSWVRKYLSSGTTDPVTIQSNQLDQTNSDARESAYSSGHFPTEADYTVSADVRQVSATAATNSRFILRFRTNDTTGAGYGVYFQKAYTAGSNGTVTIVFLALASWDDDTGTQIGATYTSGVINLDKMHALSVACSGNSFSVMHDGVEVLAIIDPDDLHPDAGVVGMFIGAASSVDRRWRIDNFAVSYSTPVSEPAPIEIASIGGETLVLNRTVETARATTKAPTRDPEALVYVAQADFGTVFTLRIDGIPLSYSTVDGSTPTSRDAIATDVIALAIKNLIEAQSTLSAYTVEQYGSVLHIYRTDGEDFSIDSGDGLADNGLRVVKGQVQLFVDLPSRAAPGFVVEVVGEPLSQADNYFLEYTDGVWQECPKPGSLVGLDPSTMPHRLILGRDLLPHLVSKGFPSRPTAQPFGDDPVPVLIGKEVDGDTQDENDDLTERAEFIGSLAESDCIFSNLSPLTGAPATVRVNYDFVNLLDAGDIVSVKVYTSDLTAGAYGSRVWTEVASKEYSTPGSFVNEFIEFQTTEPADTDIRIAAIYDAAADANAFKYAYIQVHSYNDTLPGVTVTVANDIKVQFPQVIYPAGTTFTLTLDNGTPADFDYLLTEDMLGEDVADALRALVDASGDYSATAQATGAFIIEATPYAAFTATISDDFDDSTTLFNPDAGLAPSALVDGTIYNMSDGSSGVITANTETTITVAAGLSGGTSNVFAAGDSVRAESDAPNDFIFQEVNWLDREAGDFESNPYPHFIGKTISALTFHHGRLALVSEDSVTFSDVEDYRRLHRRWVSIDGPGEAFSFRVPAEHKLNFFAASTWDGRLLLWDDVRQFYLSSGEQPFTAQTVSARPFTSYKVSRTCRPLVQGSAIYFTRGRRIYELAIRGEASQPLAIDLTEHCPTYIESDPLFLVGDASLGILAVLTADDPMYVCFQPNLPRERHYAWGTWDFSGDRVVGASVEDGTMSLVVSRPDGLYLETLDLDAGNGG